MHSLTTNSYTGSVDISQLTGSVRFNVTLHDDTVEDTDGTITATVQEESAKYTLGAQSKTAVVRVQDDDSLPTFLLQILHRYQKVMDRSPLQ